MNRKLAACVRYESVRAYLADNKSLRVKARELGIHYTTLFRWIKRYKNGGEEAMNEFYKADNRWNALPMKTKELIMKLKEARPALTVHQAGHIMTAGGIKVSVKEIWRVWQDYGFTGFKKEKFANNFRLYITPNPRIVFKAQAALKHLSNGDNINAAKIANSLPYCPVDEVLEKIPDRFLNLRRKIEKLPLITGQLPYIQFRKKAHILRCQAEKRNWNYSALRAGTMELLASGWVGDPAYQLILAQHLEKIVDHTGRFGDLGILLTILIYKGRAYAGLLKIEKAIEHALRCKIILRNRRAPNIKRTLSTLFATLGLNNVADELIKNAHRECTEDYERSNCGLLMALYEATKGDYRAARRKLKQAATAQSLANASSYSLVRANCALGEAKLQEAQKFATMALNQSHKTGLRNNLHFSSLVLASTYMYLDEQKRAYSLLKRFDFLFQKYNMKKHIMYRSSLMNMENIEFFSEELNLVPELHLIVLLRKAAQSHKYCDYIKAYKYAKRKDIVGIFHQFVPFYGEAVISLLKKAKATLLPRTLARLPVFNKEIPVYHMQYLGPPIVDKNQVHIKTKLKPLDAAFLIHFLSKAPEPGKSANVDEIYRNFWSRSRNPSYVLSHLLVRIKKALKLPSHLLIFSTKTGGPSLTNAGIYFTTDNQEFEQILAHAKALERAGEWNFARTEYQRAFRLFRGEPFKKNFDRWSLDSRHQILSQLETEVINFAKSCDAHKNKKHARKILGKTLKVMPDSDEVKQLLKHMTVE